MSNLLSLWIMTNLMSFLEDSPTDTSICLKCFRYSVSAVTGLHTPP